MVDSTQTYIETFFKGLRDRWEGGRQSGALTVAHDYKAD